MSEGRQESILNALLQRILVGMIGKIEIGVHVLIHARRGGQTQLHRWLEVFQYASPITLILGSSAMTLIDDNQVEEILGVLPEVWRIIRPAHKRLEDGEEDAAVSGHLTILGYRSGLDSYHRILLKPAKVYHGLISQYVPVCQE